MTEVLRPRQGLVGRGDRPAGRPVDGPLGPDAAAAPTIADRQAVTRTAAARTAKETRLPYHVGVFLGLSAGAYAVSLAGVTLLQSTSDQAIMAQQAPVAAAAAQLTAGHDSLQARLDAGRSAYQAAGDAYQQVSESLAAFEQQLDALGTKVSTIAGSASSLPTRVALPAVPRAAAPAAAAPKVVATTGASGKP